MAEYIPFTMPGVAITRKASAAITAGQIVEVTGSLTVGPAGAASVKWYGVAAFDAQVNDNVTVYRGAHEGAVLTTGAVAAGDALAPGATATVATSAAVTGAGFVGVAANAAAAGAKVIVGFNR